MSVITQALILGRDMIFRPGRAFERLRSRSLPGWSGFQAAVLIYLFTTIVHSVFYSLKPVNFPSQAGQIIMQRLSTWQWLGAELSWGTLFTAVWFLFLVFFLGIFRSGKLPLKLGLAIIPAALPMALIAYQTENSVPALALAGIWFAIVGLSGFAAFRLSCGFPHEMLKSLVSLLLSASAIALFIMPVQIAALALNWENGYIAVLYMGGFWIMGLCAAGIRAIAGTGLARSVLALVLSLILNIEMLFSLSLGKLVSENVMRVMLAP